MAGRGPRGSVRRGECGVRGGSPAHRGVAGRSQPSGAPPTSGGAGGQSLKSRSRAAPRSRESRSRSLQRSSVRGWSPGPNRAVQVRRIPVPGPKRPRISEAACRWGGHRRRVLQRAASPKDARPFCAPKVGLCWVGAWPNTDGILARTVPGGDGGEVAWSPGSAPTCWAGPCAPGAHRGADVGSVQVSEAQLSPARSSPNPHS